MFARMALLFVVGISLCAQEISAGVEEKPSSSEEQRREEIHKLIEQLNAESFKVREEATRRLMACDEALTALREAAKSEDAEVRRRAEKAIAAITQRRAKRAIQRAIDKLKNGQTDQFVDAMVRWRDYADEDCWKAVLEHFHVVNDKATKASGGQFKLGRSLPRIKPALPWDNLNKLQDVNTDHLKKEKPAFITGKRIIANRISVLDGDIRSSFLICRGPVRIRYTLANAVLLVNGNLDMGERGVGGMIVGCVVICDGDVRATTLADSVVICTGKVSVGAAPQYSVVISGGDVKMGLEFPGAAAKNSLIQKRHHLALDCIRFFEPDQVGIEVQLIRNHLRIEGIAAARAFGRAGIRTGDEVVAVNGTKVDSPQAFRRLLRCGMQEVEPIVLKIRRGEKILAIEVNVSEEPP